MGGGGGTGEEKPAHRIILGAVPGQFPPFQLSVVSIFFYKEHRSPQLQEDVGQSTYFVISPPIKSHFLNNLTGLDLKVPHL